MMKKNFATQNDMVIHYTLNDLDMGKVRSSNDKPFTNSGNYANATGILDTINGALGVFSSAMTTQQQQANNDAALQNAQLQLQQQQAQAQLSAQRWDNIKKVVLPISILLIVVGGGVIIYKYSKK